MATTPRKSKDPNVTAFNTVQTFLARQESPKATFGPAMKSQFKSQFPPGMKSQLSSGGITAYIKAEREKNPAAVALGRLGGLKGGKARAASLTKKERSEIAKNAAVKRWSKNKPK